MNITLETNFYNLSPTEKKRVLRFYGITLEELAIKHNCSVAYISMVLDGKRSKKLLKKISRNIDRKVSKNNAS